MKRHSEQAVAWEKLVKKRTGVTRTQPQAIVKGMPIARLIGPPEIVRERWYGQRLYFCILRFRFQTADGQIWTTLQARCISLRAKYTRSISGFWNVQPERNVKNV